MMRFKREAHATTINVRLGGLINLRMETLQ
jgi:hypothetical protein